MHQHIDFLEYKIGRGKEHLVHLNKLEGAVLSQETCGFKANDLVLASTVNTYLSTGV